MNIDKYKDKQTVAEYTSYLTLEMSASKNTKDAYLEDLSKLLDHATPLGFEPENITKEEIEDFLIDLSELGISARSQARIISGIKSFFKFLVLNDKIDVDPSELIESPQIGKHLPEVLSLQEIDAIEDAIDLSEQLGHRNKAIIEVLYSCGLRVSELLGLKISDIYLDEQFINVIGKGDKQRLVPISPSALKEIKLWLDTRRLIDVKKGNEDYVFLNKRGTKLSRVMVFYIVKELAEKAGVQKNISPHTFRHSFATHLLEGGANLRDIQEMLGHSSILTTEIYTHLDMNLLRDNILLYHPMNNKGKRNENEEQ